MSANPETAPRNLPQHDGASSKNEVRALGVPLRGVHAAFALAVLLLVANAARRSFQPIRHVLTIVPDDAFYYLSLARHFSQSGVWTFDGGLSRTTGFHPLHAYVCALVAHLLPDASPSTVIVVHAWIGTVVTVLALWFLLRVVGRQLGSVATLGVVVVSAGSNFLTQSTNVMEWHWVVLFASLTVYAIVEGRAWLCFIAALVGAWARSDFPLLVVAAVGAAAFVAYRTRDRRLLRYSLYALAGAVTGFALLCAHNYVISHELIQSSARIKAFWGKTVGYHLRYGVEIAAIAAAPGSLLIEVGGHSILSVVAIHLVLAVILFVLLRKFPASTDAATPRTGGPERTFLLVLGIVATAGYAAVYAKSSVAIMTWYTANFVVPVALLYASALGPVRWRYAFPTLFAALVFLGAIGFRNADRPQLPTFDYEMDAAQHLKDHPPEGRVGGWNVGILNYFEGGDVVNIDGLTNNNVVPYILADKLHCYLLANDVRHVLDWQAMVACKGAHCPNYPALGGYTSGVFQRSLKLEYVVPGTETMKNSLVMYSVDMGTLASAGDCGQEQASP